MEQKQDKPCWFLIKHNCGSIFTIKSSKFPQKCLICPNCGKIIMHELLTKNFRDLLKKYKEFKEGMKETNCSIREISPKELNDKSLQQILFTESKDRASL